MSQIAEEIESEAATEAVVKKFMFVNRKAPYGTIYALEEPPKWKCLQTPGADPQQFYPALPLTQLGFGQR